MLRAEEDEEGEGHGGHEDPRREAFTAQCADLIETIMHHMPLDQVSRGLLPGGSAACLPCAAGGCLLAAHRLHTVQCNGAATMLLGKARLGWPAGDGAAPRHAARGMLSPSRGSSLPQPLAFLQSSSWTHEHAASIPLAQVADQLAVQFLQQRMPPPPLKVRASKAARCICCPACA